MKQSKNRVKGGIKLSYSQSLVEQTAMKLSRGNLVYFHAVTVEGEMGVVIF